MPAELDFEPLRDAPNIQPITTTMTQPGKREKPKRLVKQYRTVISASSASLLSTAVAFPLDSVKTRMQTYKYKGVIDCIRHTYQTEHVRGFFRGVTAPMASITLVRTISFSIYQRAKYIYSDWIKINIGPDVLGHVNTPGTYPNVYSLACFTAAGATAGIVVPVVACPFELTKLSAQVSVLMANKSGQSKGNMALASSYQNKGTFKTMANIVKNRGFLGLYSGFNLHVLRDTLGTAIYFGVYESVKQLGQTFGGNNPHGNGIAVFGAGGLCGIVSWAIIYPIDSAKSIYQRNSLMYTKGEKVEPRPKIEFFKRHMYRGLGVSMGRSCAVNAIFFSVFEFIKKRIDAMKDD